MRTVRRIIIKEPGKLELERGDLGAPAPDHARVELILGGICGSDLAAYLGTSPMVRYPRVIGHELVGRVVEVSLPSGVEVNCDGEFVNGGLERVTARANAFRLVVPANGGH